MDNSDEKNLPIGTYLKVWGIVIALVTLSYAIFLLEIEPLWLRRFLFTAIALIQATLGVRYFMQMRWERPSLVYAIVLPVTLLLALVIFALSEGRYVLGVRQLEYSAEVSQQPVRETPQGPAQGGLPGMQTGNLVELGKQLAQSNGCLSCHSITGARLVGPSWKGLYGSTRELEGGATVIADEAYLKESIVNPAAKIVKGFSPVMPPFTFLSDEEIQAIIEYIKSLSKGE